MTKEKMSMSASILVTYATRYGSTQEVAEAVAAALREAGHEVDLQPLRKVGALEKYSLVVLGAPLYIGHWHKEAHRFLEQQRAALAQRPVAVFALGPLHEAEEQWRNVSLQLDKELAKHTWLAPAATAIFGGKYDPAKLRLSDKVLAMAPASPLYQIPACDLRDWAAIRLWTEGLAVKAGLC
jgi:menaquinone-dependent protoporphyrinogen oxidase